MPCEIAFFEGQAVSVGTSGVEQDISQFDEKIADH